MPGSAVSGNLEVPVDLQRGLATRRYGRRQRHARADVLRGLTRIGCGGSALAAGCPCGAWSRPACPLTTRRVTTIPSVFSAGTHGAARRIFAPKVVGGQPQADRAQRVGTLVMQDDGLAAGEARRRRVERHADRVVGAQLPVVAPRLPGRIARPRVERTPDRIGHRNVPTHRPLGQWHPRLRCNGREGKRKQDGNAERTRHRHGHGRKGSAKYVPGIPVFCTTPDCISSHARRALLLLPSVIHHPDPQTPRPPAPR